VLKLWTDLHANAQPASANREHVKLTICVLPSSRRRRAEINVLVGLLGSICSLALLAACGGGSTTSSSDPVKEAAATKFEELDNAYFKASSAAVAKGRTIAPDAFQQAMNGLADANHAFAQGLQDIPFPDAAQADAKALLAATVQVETDAVLLGNNGNVAGSSAIGADLDKRNGTDRQLRKDLGLDPNEAPAPGG
jgi:hypothetical protein